MNGFLKIVKIMCQRLFLKRGTGNGKIIIAFFSPLDIFSLGPLYYYRMITMDVTSCGLPVVRVFDREGNILNLGTFTSSDFLCKKIAMANWKLVTNLLGASISVALFAITFYRSKSSLTLRLCPLESDLQLTDTNSRSSPWATRAKYSSWTRSKILLNGSRTF